MPRRASSSVHPLWIIGAFALVAAALGGGWYLYQLVSDPFRTLTPLDVPSYMDNSNSLRGNVYKITGVIGNKLAWSPETGSLYALEVEHGTVSDPLPVLVPRDFSQLNIQKGQRFSVRVEVNDTGVLVARELRKT